MQGVVVFFPSFSYAAQVQSAWVKSGVWAELGAKKTLFTEPRNAGEVEAVLAEYADCMPGKSKVLSPQTAASGKTRAGAVLFCVVGGKMSEGINFSDGLGRCVWFWSSP